MRREEKFSAAGDGRCGVGPRNTHFSSQKVDFSRDRHDGGFQPYQSHYTAFPLVSYIIRDYAVESYNGYSFSVADGDGIDNVGHMTTQLSPNKVA